MGKEQWLVRYPQLILCAWLAIAVFSMVSFAFIWNKYIERRGKKAVTERDQSSVFLGLDAKSGEKIHLKEEFRTAHTQVIGSTNAGKTASVILPWAVQDIEQGRGLIIVDGKPERGFIEKLYSHIVKNNRQNDFMVFSLANPAISSTYNPFCDGTPEQITERSFATFNLTDPYYGSVQFSALRTVIALLVRRGEKPMPGVIRELLRDKEKLASWLPGLEDKSLIADLQAMLKDKDEDFEKKYSGLVTALGHFSQGFSSRLYNTRNPEIQIKDIIKRQKICYFQLPTMEFPFLGEATGKLILQSLQSTISELQASANLPRTLFSVYLDDFNDYIYPGFASLLNKSRSANVGIVFSHQSLGDLEKVSPDFKQIVSTNTNIKVIMRSNDPESAEHFAKLIGTRTIEKTTERRTKGLIGWRDTGERSVRETEEYVFHPNTFKSGLGRGEGVVVIPHPKGTKVSRVKFSMAQELPKISMPIRDLPELDISAESVYRGATYKSVKSLSKTAA